MNATRGEVLGPWIGKEKSYLSMTLNLLREKIFVKRVSRARALYCKIGLDRWAMAILRESYLTPMVAGSLHLSIRVGPTPALE